MDTWTVINGNKNDYVIKLDSEDEERVQSLTWTDLEISPYEFGRSPSAKFVNYAGNTLENYISEIATSIGTATFKNGNRMDFRKSNLVVTKYTFKEQAELRSKRPKKIIPKSGVKGIVWETRCNRWVVTITQDSKKTYIGKYKELEDAIEGRRVALDKQGG